MLIGYVRASEADGLQVIDLQRKALFALGIFEDHLQMTAATLRLAQAAMGQPGTNVSELCAELGITRQRPHRHVSPQSAVRAGGKKQLGRRRQRA